FRSVAFIGCLGVDALGDQAVASMNADGIDTSACRRDTSAPSGVAQILVAADGENCIAVAPGANARLSPADIASADALFSAAALVLLQLETPLETVQAALAAGRNHGCYTVLNPAPACDLPPSLLTLVDLITPNETEAEYLTGIAARDDSGAEQAASALHEKGVRDVILTRGSAGVTLSQQTATGSIAVCHLPAYAVTAVDTTAAGDVFNGCLVTALAEGSDLANAIPFAQAASAIAVQQAGAQSSVPRREAITGFLARHGR
ncbi:MAG: PfkB family carbohydrate kinase, partial [Chromatocurvus sp.]